jgi:hypothetical protein
MAEEGAIAGIGDDVEPFGLGFGCSHAGILCGFVCNRIPSSRG